MKHIWNGIKRQRNTTRVKACYGKAVLKSHTMPISNNPEKEKEKKKISDNLKAKTIKRN